MFRPVRLVPMKTAHCRIFIFLIGVLFSLWGFFCVVMIINNISGPTWTNYLDSYLHFLSEEPPVIYFPFYIFWGISGIVIAFGLWSYSKWARVLTITISLISIIPLVYKFVANVLNIYKWQRIHDELAAKGTWISYFTEPAEPYLLLALGFAVIIFFMFLNNTKLVIEHKGILGVEEEKNGPSEFFWKLFFTILAITLIAYLVYLQTSVERFL